MLDPQADACLDMLEARAALLSTDCSYSMHMSYLHASGASMHLNQFAHPSSITPFCSIQLVSFTERACEVCSGSRQALHFRYEFGIAKAIELDLPQLTICQYHSFPVKTMHLQDVPAHSIPCMSSTTRTQAAPMLVLWLDWVDCHICSTRWHFRVAAQHAWRQPCTTAKLKDVLLGCSLMQRPTCTNPGGNGSNCQQHLKPETVTILCAQAHVQAAF